MKDETFKQVYSILMLLITIAWAVFVLLLVHHAMTTKDSVDILAASGAGGLLGALMTWVSLQIQFYFRKKPEEGKKP